MMAVLARKRFGAGDWQTLMITASVPTLLILSIFWNGLLQRVSLRRYLLIQWACNMVPLALAAFAQSFWFLLVCHLLAAAGAAGWSPVSGDLLRRFYPDRVRGRAFAAINTAIFGGMTVASLTVGSALDWDENVFRMYFPIAAAAYLAGVLILRYLIRQSARPLLPTANDARLPLSLRSLLGPVLNLRQVLAADRTFYRYEAAFMTYGAGWMICNALLPVLATDRLKMSYTAFAGSTQGLYAASLLVMIYPMGWILDRVGAARTSVWSFALLAFYPLGLMLAPTVSAVAAITVLYGVAMAGVQMTWMLGPVSLAPAPDKVAQYVAIHTTLVGLRGIIAQGMGMLLYRLTGSFTGPFLVAAAAFAWASWQMRRLDEATRAAEAPPLAAPPEPA